MTRSRRTNAPAARYRVAPCLAIGGALAPAAAAPAITPGATTIALKPLTNISTPVIDMANIPGDPRLYIASQGSGTDATVRLFQNNALAGTPFLDFNTAGLTVDATAPESGLLGIAFDPNFNAPPGTPGRGKFYTYSSEPKNTSVTPDFSNPELGATGGAHDNVLREWTVADPSNPNTVNYAAGSRIIMRVRKPQDTHNAGSLKFGPDGYLYLSLGDGGGANDNSGGVTSTTDGHSNPDGNAQTLVSSDGSTNVYGKILRIDPRPPSSTLGSTDPVSANGQYRVPAANPFVNASTGRRQEIYAFGLRNPFRISFDRLTGSLYAGDVGQSQREEVDVITPGGNYGWAFMEGSVVNTTRTAPAGFTSIAPIAEYTHADGVAVIGGFVYRGSNIPELYGKYVFGDWSYNNAGRLFYMDAAGGTISEFSYYSGKLTTQGLQGFGQDRNGELYALLDDGTVDKILGRQWNAAGNGSWSAAGNWIGPAPASSADGANFLGETAGPATVTLDGNRTVGSLLFNNATNSYTISSGTGGTLTVSRAAAPPTITVLAGSHTIAAPLMVAGSPQLTIAAGAALTLSGPVTGKFGIPSIDPAGKLDLKTNDLIVDYGPAVSTPLPTLRQLIASAYANNTWSGPGITTTTGAHGVGLAYAEASRLLNLTGTKTATWDGQTVDATTVLIKYTWYGDLNLDGVINADDYALMDRSVAKGAAPGAAQWLDGDFNYDGSLTPADYLLMDTAFGIQSGPLSPDFLAQRESQFGDAYVQELLTSIPEPASPLACLFAGFLFARRRGQR